MALLFLIIGIASLAISYYFYSKKEIQYSTPQELSKQKGNNFEDYVIKLLANQKDITFAGKVSDYHKNGISATENTEPDLKFKYQQRSFAVECKWRNSFKNGNIEWAKSYQIRNYIRYQAEKKEKVFVAIGIGGKSDAPEELFLVPLYRLPKEFANESYIKEFKIENPNQLLHLLKKSF